MSADKSRETLERAILLEQASALLGDANPKEIAEKVRQLERGLPKEDEFLATCVWMGQCSVIHKLDQNQLPSKSRDVYQVPDFFAAFDAGGKQIPALVEVKSGQDIKFRPFGNNYYTRLSNYAKLLKLPLLIAWHITSLNLWCLFDISLLERRRTAYHIDFDTAMNNNLLGMLFDDVIITLRPGNRIVYRFKKTGKELRDAGGKLIQFSGLLGKPYLLSSTDQEIASDSALGKLLQRIFYIVDNEEQFAEDAEYVTLTFQGTRKETLFASQLLGVITFGTSALDDGNSSWNQAIRNNRFSMDYSTIRDAFSEGVKSGVISSIIRQNPTNRPQFLN